MDSQRIPCHLPECTNFVNSRTPRRLSEFTFGLCQEMESLLPGTKQNEPLCTSHYNSMYTNPSRKHFQAVSTAPLLPEKRKQRNKGNDLSDESDQAQSSDVSMPSPATISNTPKPKRQRSASFSTMFNAITLNSEDERPEVAPVSSRTSSRRCRINVEEEVFIYLHDIELQQKYNVRSAGALVKALLQAAGEIIEEQATDVTESFQFEPELGYLEQFSEHLHKRYGFPGSASGPRFHNDWKNDLLRLNSPVAKGFFDVEVINKWKTWILRSLPEVNTEENITLPIQSLETMPYLNTKASKKGRPYKNWAETSPKVVMLQTKMFRQFISQVVCAKVVYNKVCGRSLRIINEKTLGCPAMKFELICNQGHKTKFVTSAKDHNCNWVLKNAPIVASIITGSTETILNGFLEAMQMTTIPKSHFYNFQRDHLRKHIENKCAQQLNALQVEAKQSNNPLVLEFDARHASVRRALQSTASWLDFQTGKVIYTVTEEHDNNYDSATSEARCFSKGMSEMLEVQKLKIGEIIHDDCQELSNWLEETANEKWNNNIIDSKEMWHKEKNIKKNWLPFYKLHTPIISSKQKQVALDKNQREANAAARAQLSDKTQLLANHFYRSCKSKEVCLNYEPVRTRKDGPSDMCWHCNQHKESHGKACTWFDPMFEDRYKCRSCYRLQEDHRVCDKFKGPYEPSCLYCGQPSEMHRLCSMITRHKKVTSWCDTCGRHYNDHSTYTFEVEIVTRNVTEAEYEAKRRFILAQRIEAQWESATYHFQGTDPKFHKTCLRFDPHVQCCQPGFIPNWLPITSPVAQNVFNEYIHRREIINNLQYYINARSTADVESFNNVITIYAPKRIHFKYYKMRVALAVLHWNENCRRVRTRRLEHRGDKAKENRVRGQRYYLAPQTFRFRQEIMNYFFASCF